MPTDNKYAQASYEPERIEQAAKYASTKFFRLMLDLQRCAQWEPIHPSNSPFGWGCFRDNRRRPLPTDDCELYKLFDFTPAMIRFVEERYNDELLDARNAQG